MLEQLLNRNYFVKVSPGKDVVISANLIRVHSNGKSNSNYNSDVCHPENYSTNGHCKKGILLLPGMSEYKESLAGLAEKLSGAVNSDDNSAADNSAADKSAADASKQECSTLVMDLNGQGHSTGNCYLEDIVYSIKDVARQFKNELHLDKLGIYGNSLGGIAAGIAVSELNVEEPGFVSALCLSSTLPSLRDYASEVMCSYLHDHPSFAEFGLKAFNLVQYVSNHFFRERTAKRDKEEHVRLSFGATKISNIKEFVEHVRTSPSLMDYASQISAPSMLIYGSKDPGVKMTLNNDTCSLRFDSESTNGLEKYGVPEKIKHLYCSLRSEKKTLIIVNGADHSLNVKTPEDCDFNAAPEYQWVKDEIKGFFDRHLSNGRQIIL